MAREVVTKIWCDVCLTRHNGDNEEPNHTPGKEIPPVAIGGRKPRRLALCETDWKELYEPFVQALDELGQIVPDGEAPAPSAPKAKKSRAGVYPCPDPACPKHVDPYSKPSSLSNHARGTHGMTINELRVSLGQEPVNPVERANAANAAARLSDDEIEDLLPDPETEDPNHLACPVEGCGKVYAVPEYQQPKKARAVHMAKVHGIRAEKHRRKEVAAAK